MGFGFWLEKNGLALLVLVMGGFIMGMKIKYKQIISIDGLEATAKDTLSGRIQTIGGFIMVLAGIVFMFYNEYYVAPLEYANWQGKWLIEVIEPGKTVDPTFEAVGKVIEEDNRQKIIFTASSKEWGIVKFTPAGKENKEPSNLRGRFSTQDDRRDYFDLHLDVDGKGFIAKIYSKRKNPNEDVIVWVGEKIK